MATYYKNSSGKFLVYNNKLIIKAASPTLPTSYEFRGEYDGDYVEMDFGNGRKVLLQYDERSAYPYHFSADFSLAIIADGYQWGTYELSEYFMQQTIYIYDLGENYGWGDENPAAYITSNFTPIGILNWDYGSGCIYVTYPS